MNNVPAPRTAAANQARRLHTARNLDLLRTTLQKMQREQTPITVSQPSPQRSEA